MLIHSVMPAPSPACARSSSSSRMALQGLLELPGNLKT